MVGQGLLLLLLLSSNWQLTATSNKSAEHRFCQLSSTMYLPCVSAARVSECHKTY
jgi:hypothetical protein